MIKWFIIHQWKSGVRSTIRQKNLVLNIIIGFFIFLMIAYLLILGLFISRIMQEVYPDQDHVAIFNGFLLYYFIVDLFMRFMMQNLPKINIESYIHLPLKKKLIVHYIVNRTSLAIFNFLPFLIFVPVAVKIVAVQWGIVDAWIWIAGVFFLIFANNYLGTYLKRQLASKPLIVGMTGAFILLLIVLDILNAFSFSEVSEIAFAYLLTYPFLLLLPFAWMIISYRLHYNYLKKRLYPEEINIRKNQKIDNISDIRYLKSLGTTGSIIALDMRLFWRNKRTRTMIYMLPIFLLYGLFFYPNPEYEKMSGFLIFVGIFMSGGMMLNYLNYVFAYESNYFDALLTKNVDPKMYIRTKWLTGIMISSICFILTIPYIYFGVNIFFINAMTFLYNIGILSIILLYMSTYNKQRMELSRGATFNYQGIGVSNWLAMIPAFLMPVIIYWPFSSAGYPDTGLMFIGVLGLTGLSFNRYLLSFVYDNFNQRKYKMAQGFRQK
ncbi:MAG: DUF5687 family protein [Bacteroidota bacterium]|nr:DUF5687 family protein [Bacteroidota bacterium]